MPNQTLTAADLRRNDVILYCGQPKRVIAAYNAPQDQKELRLIELTTGRHEPSYYVPRDREFTVIDRKPTELELCDTCNGERDPYCSEHGVDASNRRQSDYWRRVGGHD
jgi:hypothetical protein